MLPQKSSPKRVYLDVCALCRSFDDQHQVRIQLEANAVALILSNVRQKKLELIVSAVHEAEIGAITEIEERKHLLILLSQMGTRPQVDLLATKQRAEILVRQGLGIADAAHVAFAEQVKADFVTVDDRLLKQCHRVKVMVWCGTPPNYSEKEELK